MCIHVLANRCRNWLGVKDFNLPFILNQIKTIQFYYKVNLIIFNFTQSLPTVIHFGWMTTNAKIRGRKGNRFFFFSSYIIICSLLLVPMLFFFAFAFHFFSIFFNFDLKTFPSNSVHIDCFFEEKGIKDLRRMVGRHRRIMKIWTFGSVQTWTFHAFRYNGVYIFYKLVFYRSFFDIMFALSTNFSLCVFLFIGWLCWNEQRDNKKKNNNNNSTTTWAIERIIHTILRPKSWKKHVKIVPTAMHLLYWLTGKIPYCLCTI